MVPVCYALLPDKNSDTYKRLFRLLQRKAAQFNLVINPTIIQVDFEKAVINTISEVFPLASIRGCYFHFTQSIWRAVQRHGLTVAYREDGIVAKIVRRTLGLPFLTANRVENVWLRVIEECPQQCQEFVDYVTSTYVDEINACFPHEIWCHFDNATGIRTNNDLESRNGKFKQVFRRHPNIFRFIECLKDVQEEEELNLRGLRAGVAPPTPRRKYAQATERLQRLKTLLERGEIDAWDYCGKCSVVSGLQKH